MTRVTERILVLDGSATLRPRGRRRQGREHRPHARARAARAAGVRPADRGVPPLPRRRRRARRRRCWEAVLDGVAGLERDTGRRLGDPEAPLLVSVRSGAAVSMPGMMDTILNLGMTDAVEEGLARLSGDAAFARETHVRFVHEFGHTVLGADLDPPGDDATADEVRAEVRTTTRARRCRRIRTTSCAPPIHAVFGSWSSRRAIAYRRHWGIPEDGGTAVVVQAMVFGNLGERLRHRRAVHARPAERRRPSRTASGCRAARARTWSAARTTRCRWRRCTTQLPEAHDELLDAGRAARARERRRPGRRVHRRARPAVPAADALGQALAAGRGAHRRRPRRRGRDRPRRGARPRQRRAARHACWRRGSPEEVTAAAEVARARHAGLPGRRRPAASSRTPTPPSVGRRATSCWPARPRAPRTCRA